MLRIQCGNLPINEAIEEEGVHRQTPVRRRGMISVVDPLAPVVEGIDSGLVLIKIISSMVRAVSQGINEDREGNDDN